MPLDILGGGLQPIFAKAMGRYLLPTTLHPATVSSNGVGGVSRVDGPPETTRGMVQDYSKAYRQAASIQDGDVKIMVLQHGLATEPTTDTQVTIRNKRYRVIAITQDPAKVTWTFQARPI